MPNVILYQSLAKCTNSQVSEISSGLYFATTYVFISQSVYLLGSKVTQHDGGTRRPGSDLTPVLLLSFFCQLREMLHLSHSLMDFNKTWSQVPLPFPKHVITSIWPLTWFQWWLKMCFLNPFATIVTFCVTCHVKLTLTLLCFDRFQPKFVRSTPGRSSTYDMNLISI